ncbi:MAG: alpha/beta hydrolase [Flavobacteriales bacterium]|nr:alpha/beta hydrolase [Flavobacteriales bacterium]
MTSKLLTMKNFTLIILMLHFCLTAASQEIVKLPHEESAQVIWEGEEKEYFSNIWNTQVVTNVSVPTLSIFKPAAEKNTGVSVVIAPGGGLYALSIESEGRDVAKWLNEKGITAFVLKYRLVPTGADGVAEISELSQNNPAKIGEEVTKTIPYSIKDGLEAISYARENAEELGIDKNKIGFMGFSAGGAVTMGVAYSYDEKNRPDFLVPVYAWTDAMPVQKPQKEAPPMLLICASDDPLGLATGSIKIYNSWHSENLNVSLHMYSKGGHGFGMRKQGLPSDTWIERFYDWTLAEEIVTPN